MKVTGFCHGLDHIGGGTLARIHLVERGIVAKGSDHIFVRAFEQGRAFVSLIRCVLDCSVPVLIDTRFRRIMNNL